LKHSGEVIQTVYRWKCDDLWTLEQAAKITNMMRSRCSTGPDFSASFIKVLNQEFVKTLDEDGDLGVYTMSLALLAELKRLLQRSCLLKKMPGETKKEFSERRQQAIAEIFSPLKFLYDNSYNLQNFLSLINILDFMERKVSHDH